MKLTLMINVINGWNRLAVGFGTWVDPAVAKAAARRQPDGGAGPRTQRQSSIRCVRASCASPIACWARWRTPRTWCRRPSSAGWGPTANEMREPEAFLRRMVTRLCLDQLKSARAPARDLCRPLASRSRRAKRRRGRRHAAADARAGAALSARARGLPAA